MFANADRDPHARFVPRITRRELAVLVGIVTALHTWWTWGAWQPRPLLSDEFSYVVQAKIFASGHWVGPSPPSEAAFQQSHLLVTPVLASKYPPGHALLLAVGVLVGVIWLVPIVLAGIAGAVLFLLMAECGQTLAALCGWAYWLSDPLALRFRPGYYSESTSGLTWLLAWWLLRRWQESPQRRYLVWLSVVVGWCAITRPLTAVALALPMVIYLWKPLVVARRWKDVIAAGAAGTCVVGILAAADYSVTKNPFTTAFAFYAQQYLPVDKLGFHLDSTPPRFRLAAPSVAAYEEIRRVHVGHVPARLPSIAAQQLKGVAVAEWASWRVAFVPLIVIGLWGLSSVAWIAVANAVALFLIYLCWAHWYGWTIYYSEALPVFALLISNGVRSLSARVPHTRPVLAAAIGLALVYAAAVMNTTAWWRTAHIVSAREGIAFDDALAHLPFAGSVVFVRYDTTQHGQPTVVVNSPTWEHDPIWVVNSWGPSVDLKLMAFSEQRVPLLLDERTQHLSTYSELLDSLRARR